MEKKKILVIHCPTREVFSRVNKEILGPGDCKIPKSCWITYEEDTCVVLNEWRGGIYDGTYGRKPNYINDPEYDLMTIEEYFQRNPKKGSVINNYSIY